eukprot:scaffold9130_cov124-Isochrysis_galbana.AAC.1
MTSICDTLRQLLDEVAQHEQLLRKGAKAAELWLLSGRQYGPAQHGPVIERMAQPPLQLSDGAALQLLSDGPAPWDGAVQAEAMLLPAPLQTSVDGLANNDIAFRSTGASVNTARALLRLPNGSLVCLHLSPTETVVQAAVARGAMSSDLSASGSALWVDKGEARSAVLAACGGRIGGVAVLRLSLRAPGGGSGNSTGGKDVTIPQSNDTAEVSTLDVAAKRVAKVELERKPVEAKLASAMSCDFSEALEVEVAAGDCNNMQASGNAMAHTPACSHTSIESGAEATADAAAPDTLLDAKPLRHDWTVAKWLASLGVSQGEPDGVIVRMLARALLPQPNKDGDNELHRIRELAKDMPVEKLETTLRGVCKELAKELHTALGELAKETAAVGVPPEGESKFAGGIQQLSFSGLDTFFGSLEGLVGAPAPKVREAMQAEHTDRVDSYAPFVTGNYGIQTTSKQEWCFVVMPDPLTWQTEAIDKIEDKHRRKPQPLSEFVSARNGVNLLLKGLNQPEMTEEELIGGRLYTGPLYVKYNSVLRGCRESDPPGLRELFKKLCGGPQDEKPNLYTTTLHVINSCIVKLSKLTKAIPVYRGLAGKSLPDSFWTANHFGVRGGIEAAFMSTTTDRSVAMGYAKGKTGLLFEMRMGMADRGADLTWLSQYPHEKEVLFGPLSGLEVQSTRVEGSVQIVQMQLSINLASLTIEQVVSKRRKVVQDMCEQMQLGFKTRMASDNTAWSGFFKVAGIAAEDVANYLRGWHHCYSHLDPSHYNEDSALGGVIAEVVLASTSVSMWPEQFHRLRRNMEPSAREQMLGAEELVLNETAHGNGAAVAAVLFANKKLVKLDLKGAKLTTEEVVMVTAASNRLHTLVLEGNDVDQRGMDALGQLLSMETSALMLDLKAAKVTDQGRNQDGLRLFCIGLQKNTTLKDLWCE